MVHIGRMERTYRIVQRPSATRASTPHHRSQITQARILLPFTMCDNPRSVRRLFLTLASPLPASPGIKLRLGSLIQNLFCRTISPLATLSRIQLIPFMISMHYHITFAHPKQVPVSHRTILGARLWAGLDPRLATTSRTWLRGPIPVRKMLNSRRKSSHGPIVFMWTFWRLSTKLEETAPRRPLLMVKPAGSRNQASTQSLLVNRVSISPLSLMVWMCHGTIAILLRSMTCMPSMHRLPRAPSTDQTDILPWARSITMEFPTLKQLTDTVPFEGCRELLSPG